MDDYGITALATNMSQTQLVNNVSMAVLDKSLDLLEESGAGLLEMMEESMPDSSAAIPVPGLGQSLDIKI